MNNLDLWSQEWIEILGNSLKRFLDHDGRLNDEALTVLLSNLLELDDSIEALESLSREKIDVTYNDQIYEIYKIIDDCSKINSPLKLVFSNLASSLRSYCSSKGLIQQNADRIKSNKEHLHELKLARLDKIMRDVSGGALIQGKSRVSETKYRNINEKKDRIRPVS